MTVQNHLTQKSAAAIQFHFGLKGSAKFIFNQGIMH
jgi:hypothetical protein